ncbi:hypothetical protein Cha6605_6402 (plasmid) [Chamaesiphon minutus PCC 6605]|uniref:Uncharacterized protein n=1 Tax=Chamaesiphon minutus (strain ATCC 27169 / PCC 6605) TaxID=1173020 RepID=K9URZ4_CHAP6|nr:hypothetical protein Cha6605_6402 [Chamaesiphon minutus PCC 6605]
MRSQTFRHYRSESIGQWFYKNRLTFFKVAMRTAIYSMILMSFYNIFTGGLSVYLFLKEAVFPIFNELM